MIKMGGGKIDLTLTEEMTMRKIVASRRFIFIIILCVVCLLTIARADASLSLKGIDRQEDLVSFMSTPEMLEDFEAPNAESNWFFSNGPEFPGADGSFTVLSGQGKDGTSAGVLSFDFKKGGAYVEAYRDLAIPILCEGLSFFLSEYVPGTRIIVRLTDETSQTFQKMLTIRPDREGNWIHYRVYKDDYDVCWGGANDGVFHGTLIRVGIGVEKGINFYQKGSVIFDDVMVMKSSTVDVDPFGADLMEVFYSGNISDLIGVNIHFVKPDEKQLDLASKAGFGFVRMDLTWDVVERDYRIYDFNGYDELIRSLESRGMSALLIIDYSNPLYYDGPGEYDPKWGPQTKWTRDAYARYALEAAKHFSGKNVMLEVWNEPNIPNFWTPKPNPQHYNLLAAATLKSIQDTVQNIPVVIGAISGVDYVFINKIFRLGGLDKTDAVSIHPYRLSNPETFYQEASVIEKIVKERTERNDIPVFSGEWGYSTTWFGGRTKAALKKQALYAIRHILYNIYCKVKKIVWYDLKDDGDDPSDNEHNFGLVKNMTLKPKPAYRAIKAFYNLLPLKKENGKRTGECEAAWFDTHLIGVYGLLITGSRGKIAIIWTDREDRKSVIRIPYRENMEFFNMYGKSTKRITRKGPFYVLSLREKDGPVYIRK